MSKNCIILIEGLLFYQFLSLFEIRTKQMQVIYQSSMLPKSGCAVVLGNFDGVHLGHKKLISEAVKKASAMGLPVCVYTFSANSKSALSGTLSLITDNREKAEIIGRIGADFLFFDDFLRVKELSPDVFVRDILVGELGCRMAFCGENFSFGKGGIGNFLTLKSELAAFSSEVFCEKCVYDESGIISSTRIRSLISDGDVEKASVLLGRPFAIKEKVVHGRSLARKLGAPTINQFFPEGKILPKKGVYGTLVTIDGKKYIGVTNVGTKPTVTDGESATPVICETYIVDFCGDVYDKEVLTEFFFFVRSEKKFSDLSQLKERIALDVREVKERLKI